MASSVNRREFLAVLGGGLAAARAARWLEAAEAAPGGEQPNFIFIFCDDLGYGDLGCFGSTTIKTPRLDRMAAEGIKFTDFYVAGPVCSPSRAAFLTGRYPKRVGITGVLFPADKTGIKPEHKTIAEVLKSAGYVTACIGKWHVGHLPQFMPTRKGFDHFFGMPYSNDMKPCPLIRQDETIEEPADQDSLIERYTEDAVKFMTENKDRPFFLYFAHNMPHIPLHISERFKGKSKGGLYGDVVEAIDWSTGEVLDALVKLGIEKKTYVIFTSDNGPWLVKGKEGGSAQPLRDGKSTTWEGGMREPCIVWGPGRVPAGKVCSEMALAMDFLPTFAKLGGAKLPDGYQLDGKDISPLMRGVEGAKTPHEAFFYYNGSRLEAVRSGPWKLILFAPPAKDAEGDDAKPRLPELYNLVEDIGEKKNVAADHADVVARLKDLAEKGVKDIGGTLGRALPAKKKPATPAKEGQKAEAPKADAPKSEAPKVDTAPAK
jgi:arylsulfatase